MAKCCGVGCDCVIKGGDGVTVTGFGSQGSPYMITAEGGGGGGGGEGPPGPPNVLSIGTVDEGPANAVITGTSPAQVLNLSLPRGLEGLSVFTSATLINGSGTTAAVNPTAVSGRTVKIGDLVISSHASSPGVVGRVTAVASQTSVTVTYVGSWRGAAGTNGTNGTNGSAATVAVGTTTTGAAGSSAAVSNAGTSSAAILNFTIPKGDKGDTGPVATTISKNAQTTAYTLAVADAGKVVEVTSASGVTITVPTNASVAIPVDTIVYVCQMGAGQVTIAPAGGVTLRYASSLTTRAQYSTLLLRKRDTNEWVIGGDAS